MDIVSCCGIMCNECPVYIAAEKNDNSMKRFLAHEYSCGDRIFSPEDINCKGCRDVSSEGSKFCGECKVRECCRSNNIRLCAECVKFPCKLLSECVPEDSEQFARLTEMHEACKDIIKEH